MKKWKSKEENLSFLYYDVGFRKGFNLTWKIPTKEEWKALWEKIKKSK